MENTSTTIEVLNDLIEIHNDRIEGYEKAVKELKDEDSDLKILFLEMIDQSRNARVALGTEVQVLGADMESGTTNSGKIYRAWMDVRAIFNGHNRRTILANCHAGEDAAQKAYISALSVDGVPLFLREMIEAQHDILIGSHNEMKALAEEI